MPRDVTRGRAADHPRIRGEHLVTCISDAKRAGSSPHTRGARRRPEQPTLERGIIPAYAGSTFPLTVARGAAQDHPRIRGEHWRPISPCYSGMGSSPHTRGARARHVGAGGDIRIIPAYAGSTIYENGPYEVVKGSSPHTRGAPKDGFDLTVPVGIIPAYAGSTEIRLRRPRAEGDHPRIRGEHTDKTEALGLSQGSSPHTRGARPNTGASGTRSTDHPRIRGEHCDILLFRTVADGSSPHTRGAPSSRPRC